MKKHHIGFAIAGSILSITFLITVNLLTSPAYLWFIYPCFILILWPLSMIFIHIGEHKLLSLFGSIILLSYLITINYVHSPVHPWFLYVALPIICWPLAAFLGKKAKSLSFALGIGLSISIYYGLLNLIIAPGYPWSIYPAFAVLWWPLTLYYISRKNYFGLSLAGSAWTILFFTGTNLISSPDVLWAIYPIFAVLWWPLSIYYFRYKRENREPLEQT